MAALVLDARGIRVQIVDSQWRSAVHSYALALHAASLQRLDEFGLGKQILDRAERVETIGFYEGDRRKAGIRLANGAHRAALAILRQDVLEQLLAHALRQRGVEVLWNHEVSRLEPREASVVATIDTLEKDTVGYAVAHTEWVVARSTQLEVPLVIGADGHRSLVRRTLGLDYRPVGKPQHFAVFEFESDADLGHEMRVVMGETTTDVVWPLPEGVCRWSFELVDFTVPEEARRKDRVSAELAGAHFPLLGEDRLHALIAERAPWFQGSIGAIHWRIVVRFERRLAGAMGRGRMWLAGDAAHMTGPVGMQSMNVGLLEAYDLARQLGL